jgi:dihydrofolate reductase
MRKIILNLAVSLDGFIAGPNGEYDWCLTDADYGMTEFLQSVDCTLMGRKTFDLLAEFGDPFKHLIHHVFSKTIRESGISNVRLVSDDLLAYTKNLTRQPGKNIWLFGGSEIIDLLLQENLVDEFILSVHPVLLGDGIPLFKRRDERKGLKLIDAKPYPSGLVQLIYSK